MGKVYLVGAGPGDPGLLTVRGRELLERADVVIYDFLAAPALLRHARPDAQIIYVGKKGGDHTLPQEGINELLVRKAREADTVVRLKGGDPYVFGRGAEEAEVLVEAGIPFEAVPGVTAGVAAPAYAGIPVTHRRFASSVAFITGHEDPEKAGSDLDWPGIARGANTLVFFMGMKNLPEISARLIENGRAADTPCALVRWGTTSEQTSLFGDLCNIAQKARDAGMKPPAVLVVGWVVSLREKLDWFTIRPLFGKTVVVTRARAQASDLVKRLEEMGARVLETPTIRVVPPENSAPLDEAIARITDFDWVSFTSVNAVEYFFDRLFKSGRDARALGGAKIAAIGPATAARLKNYGLVTDILPETYRAESVVDAFSALDMKARRVLLPRAAEARPVLPAELSRMGALVTEVAAYRTIAANEGKKELLDELQSGSVDMVTFTSSSTVSNFASLFGPGEMAGLMKGVAVACIGPVTADTARSLGLSVSLVADEFTIDGLCRAIGGHCAAKSIG
ncbi:MAG: uroporphyrinogen-III C-methyltransferase [Deltaproteobacteria bacterium]|nr:uroporphyrinogen-III C-methyltransferase [Deltaproteobacteria bacterium]